MPANISVLDLLDVASDLLSANKGKPRQAHLRRAASSIYYALFHCLANHCANSFIGKGRNYGRSAWKQVYRSLEHKKMKEACKLCRQQHYKQKFPPEIQTYADLFVQCQEMRHNADYDPYKKFFKEDIRTLNASARQAIDNLQKAKRKDRKAFSAFVLLGKPKNS